MTIERYVKEDLIEARRRAERGEATLMKSHLDVAQGYAQRAGQDISVQRKEIERIGYSAAVPVELKRAREFAEKGDAPLMRVNLDLAQAYAQRAGQNISPQVADIEQVGYANAIPVKLAEAGECAEQGDAVHMNVCLDIAQYYAQEAGRDISAKVAGIKRIGSERAVPVKLAEARKDAEQGNAVLMELRLNIAQNYARRARQDISAQVAAINRVGYANAIPVKLATARKDAEQGNAPLMELRLDIAQDYAQRAGQDISAQVAEIRAGLKTI